jgi:hypothetical protein
MGRPQPAHSGTERGESRHSMNSRAYIPLVAPAPGMVIQQMLIMGFWGWQSPAPEGGV